MARTRRCNRYCVTCGGRLTYYPTLSNPKAPNEHRVLVYACTDCTRDFERPSLLAIRSTDADDPLRAVQVQVIRPARR